MAHQFNFNQVFSAELKAEIIEKRTQKYVDKFGMSERDARKRAKSEMMNKRDYARFAKVADYICTTYGIPTDADHVSISTNRYGKHSWYIKYNEIEFRLSDHDSDNLRDNTICLFPLKYSFENTKGFLVNSVENVRLKNEVLRLDDRLNESCKEFVQRSYIKSRVVDKACKDKKYNLIFEGKPVFTGKINFCCDFMSNNNLYGYTMWEIEEITNQ